MNRIEANMNRIVLVQKCMRLHVSMARHVCQKSFRRLIDVDSSAH